MMQVNPSFGQRKPLAEMSEQEHRTFVLLTKLSGDPDAAGDYAYSAIGAAGREVARPPSHDRALFPNVDELRRRHLHTMHGAGQYLAKKPPIDDADALLTDIIERALKLDERGQVLDLAA